MVDVFLAGGKSGIHQWRS